MSSLGSQLVNNWTGGFWACGSTKAVRNPSYIRLDIALTQIQIYYNSTPDSPPGLTCIKVTLQTVPVTP
jgi:hypothetical protein